MDHGQVRASPLASRYQLWHPLCQIVPCKAAEISALLHERLHHKLRGPVQRVGGWDIRQPLFQLEKYYIPDAHRVVRGVKKVLNRQAV